MPTVSTATTPNAKPGCVLDDAKKALEQTTVVKEAKQVLSDVKTTIQQPSMDHVKQALHSGMTFGDQVNPAMQRDPISLPGKIKDAFDALQQKTPQLPTGIVAAAGEGLAIGGTALGVVMTPGLVKTAISDTQATLADPKHDHKSQAIGATLEAARNIVFTGRGVAMTTKGLDVFATTGPLAANAGARAGILSASEMAGHFVPVVNDVLAVVDTGIAARMLADPNANLGAKVTSVMTAAGSVAAATEIPVVSQVGAAVSIVSSVAGVFFVDESALEQHSPSQKKPQSDGADWISPQACGP